MRAEDGTRLAGASPWRLMRALVLVGHLLAAVALAGCATTPVGTWRAAPGGPPLAAAPMLQPGDIMLVRSLDTVSALIARNCATPGVYSHSGLVCRDEQQRLAVLHLTSDGLQREVLEPFLAGRARVAFVRCQTPPSAALVDQAVAGWLAQFRAGGMQFDLAFRAGAVADGRFSCMDLISRTYQQAGLTEPFPPPATALPSDGWTVFAQALMGAPIERMPTANRVLDNPAFHLVAVWENAAVDDRRLALDDTLAACIRQYYRDGYTARPPSAASRAMASVLLTAVRPGDEHLRRLLAMRASLYGYARPVQAAVLHRWRHTPDEQVTPAQVAEWTRAAADAYRDDYFERAAAHAPVP